MSSQASDRRSETVASTLRIIVLALLALPASLALAQDEALPDQSSTLTLHVYTNLIQIPVLILGPALDYAPTVDPRKLTVTLDNGKPFHPVHVHPEGEDPIALAVVVDLSGEQPDHLGRLADALARTAKHALLAHDELGLYTVDCDIIRQIVFAPPDPERVSIAIDRALAASRQARKRPHPCSNAPRLLDALAVAVDELWHRPGRRVVLAITRGFDDGSRFTTAQVRHQATGHGVAIFGIVPFTPWEGGPSGALRGPGGRSSFPVAQNSSPSPSRGSEPRSFDELCQLTGAMLRRTPDDLLKLHIEQTIKTVRERTIIEFPRPRDTVAGDHAIEVHLANSRAVLRPAGVSVPVPDAKILADPATIRPDDPSAPESHPPS